MSGRSTYVVGPHRLRHDGRGYQPGDQLDLAEAAALPLLRCRAVSPAGLTLEPEPKKADGQAGTPEGA
jgi:hypothetical protein